MIPHHSNNRQKTPTVVSFIEHFDTHDSLIYEHHIRLTNTRIYCLAMEIAASLAARLQVPADSHQCVERQLSVATRLTQANTTWLHRYTGYRSKACLWPIILQCLNAAKPDFASISGWSCTPSQMGKDVDSGDPRESLLVCSGLVSL